MLKYILTFVVALLFCKCENNINDSGNDALIGIWKLESINNKQENILEYYPDTLDRDVTIDFVDESKVNLFGNCNYGSAKYRIYFNNITFSNVALSEMVCPIGGKWEMYLYELSYVYKYNIKDGSLYLFSDSNYDLVFSRKES